MKHEIAFRRVGYSVVSDSLQPHGLQPAKLLCPWDAPDNKTGVGCHALCQGIFPSQGQESLVGCCLWGGTELDTTEAT